METDKLRVLEAISEERLSPFLSATGNDLDRALRLYLWNIELGAAFHLPLHATEIALRNNLSRALGSCFGEEWWASESFALSAGMHDMSSVRRAEAAANRRGLPLTEAELVANLSLGFWVSLLDSRYAKTLWARGTGQVFRGAADGESQEVLRSEAQAIRQLRNRISHHEPIFARDLSRDFGRLMQFLAWLSPAKAAWIRPHCRVPALLRQKP